MTLADSLLARQREAQRLLAALRGCRTAPSARCGRELDNVYFQRHTADEIAWHARHLHWRVAGTAPVVQARLSRAEAGLQVAVYLPDQKHLFARISGFFGRRGLSILEAKIHTTRHGYALDTFTVHDPAATDAPVPRRDPDRRVRARAGADRKSGPLEPPTVGRASRHLRHFPLTPEVQIFPDDQGTHFILEIVAGDRPGLLAKIAYTLAQANINIVSAKINTLGERAEDAFLDRRRAAARRAALLRLETALYEQPQSRCQRWQCRRAFGSAIRRPQACPRVPAPRHPCPKASVRDRGRCLRAPVVEALDTALGRT